MKILTKIMKFSQLLENLTWCFYSWIMEGFSAGEHDAANRFERQSRVSELRPLNFSKNMFFEINFYILLWNLMVPSQKTTAESCFAAQN